MGFFSWQTADTKESIMNHYSGQCKTVYLLQPGGAEPIEETAYDGYGVFGGWRRYYDKDKAREATRKYLARQRELLRELKKIAREDDTND